MSRSSGERPGALARRLGGGRKAVADDAGPSSSTLDVEFGDAPAWSAWYLMPLEVLRALDNAGFDPVYPYVTGASEAKVRRRGDIYLERATAWSVERGSLVLVDAVRDLYRVDGGKFRPTEPWRLTVRRRIFAGEMKERSGTVPVDAELRARDETGLGAKPWLDAIDLLPAPVRKQVLATVPDPEITHDTLTQGNSKKGLPTDQEAGLVRATPGRMVAVSAKRTIRPRGMSPRAAAESLAATPWEVTAVTAQLGTEQITELSADRDVIEGELPRQALPGACGGIDVGET